MASARPHETPRHGQPGEASDLQYTKSDINNILIHCPRHGYHYHLVQYTLNNEYMHLRGCFIIHFIGDSD